MDRIDFIQLVLDEFHEAAFASYTAIVTIDISAMRVLDPGPKYSFHIAREPPPWTPISIIDGDFPRKRSNWRS
jgi:hypothetical protein